MQFPTYHIPVLLKEVLQYLDPKPGEIVIDGTLGGGGHSEAILNKIGPTGKLIGIDQDPQAIEESKKRLVKFGEQVVIIKDNFVDIKSILQSLDVSEVDGILLDLGVSTHQLETAGRGFSFGERGYDAPLDMRMNTDQPFKAYDVVNFYPEKQLREIFFKLGEEPFGGRIAKEIIKERGKEPIKTTGRLLEVVKRSLPPDYRFSRQHGHWASKVFRALRMEVNQELPVLENALPECLNCLKSNGRLVIISFHSLEDRIVKHTFLAWEKENKVEILTTRPLVASEEEILNNPKADSAKLRAIKKK